MGEFGVRVFDEWEWVMSKLGVTGISLKRGRFSLDEKLSWFEKDSSIEATKQ